MGRPRRIQFPGACYFITLLGNNRADIFATSQDRRQFLAMLVAAKSRHDLKVYAYCLLANRVTLLLETAQANLSAAMQAFTTAYTKHFNSTHKAAGHVFQGRYKALLVDKEHFLVEMTRYVHLEPARAGVRLSPWRYPWSSCAEYVRILDRERRALADSGEILARFGRNPLTASVRYLKWIKERMTSASDMILPVAGGLAVGSEAFLARVLSRQGAIPDGGGAARLAALAKARKILAEVAQSRGLEVERLLDRVQWRDVSAARRQAVHRIWKEARLGVTEIGRMFNRTPSAISQIVRSMEIGPGSGSRAA